MFKKLVLLLTILLFNNFNIIKVEDLHKKSNVKIDVKCDICGKENNITCQKYTKNISKYSYEIIAFVSYPHLTVLYKKDNTC